MSAGWWVVVVCSAPMILTAVVCVAARLMDRYLDRIVAEALNDISPDDLDVPDLAPYTGPTIYEQLAKERAVWHAWLAERADQLGADA